MIEIRLEETILRSPADVFAYLTELGNFQNWQEGIVRVELLDPGPWRAGTRFKTIHSFLIWNKLEDLSEILAIEPGKRIANRGGVGKTRYQEEFLFEAVPGGTHMRYRADIEPGGVFAYIKTISGWAFQSQMRRSFSKLKNLLEHPH
jgi:hypothetical protein